MSDLATSRPRSATVLKTRLLDAHSDEFAAALAWAAEDPSLEAAAARVTAARRRFVLGAATSFTYASLLAAKLSARSPRSPSSTGPSSGPWRSSPTYTTRTC